MDKYNPITIIIVNKNGSLQNLSVKDYKEKELFKKCGFKKSEDFKKQTVWNITHEGTKYNISMFGKINGRANNENKYEFPPPLDNKLFFGNCCLVASKVDENIIMTNLTLKHWENVYDKLFGGFEDLNSDETDEDTDTDLTNIPKELKTKHGYLKDDFIVDDDKSDIDFEDNTQICLDNMVYDQNEEHLVEDIGSELSEESYDSE